MQKATRKRTSQEELLERVTSYARRIREVRQDNDLTQNQIADVLHVGQRTYSDYELGNTRIPVDSLLELARYYDLDMNYMCGLTKEKHPFPKKTGN